LLARKGSKRSLVNIEREGGDPDGGLVVYESPEENIKERAKMRWGRKEDQIIQDSIAL